MKNYVRIICAAIAVVMLCATLAGCGKDDKVLKIATNAEFAPFESLENNEYVGFEVDLIKKIAEKLDKEVEFNNMEFDSVLASVTSGNCNVGLSGLTITEKRRESVDFTDSYYKVGQILVVRANDTVFTGTTKEELDAQLKNKTVGACSGYTGKLYIEGDADMGFSKIEGLTAKIYDNPQTAIADLKNGNIDAFILDDAVAKNAASKEENKNDIKVIDIPLTVELYAMAVKKGNTELLEQLNKALSELKAAGEIDTLLTKWELN